MFDALAPLLGEIEICITELFVGNLILDNFCLNHF